MPRVIVICAAVLLALTACSGQSGSSGGGLEKSTIKVGILPIPDDAALFIANSKGYFKQEGLTVQPVVIQGGAAALPQIKSGALDVSISNYVSTFLAASKGEKIRSLGGLYQAAPNTFDLMVGKDSPIKTVADLKGKTILVNTLNNVGTLAVTTTLKAAGLSAGDVKFAERPFPDMAVALAAGQADAAWMPEPFITAGQAKGFTKLADTMVNETADLPVAAWIATDDWVKSNPKTLAAFKRAITKAQQLAASDRKEVEAVLPTYTKIDAATASKITLGVYPVSVDSGKLQKVADLMKEYGYLEAPIDVKTVLADTP